MPARTLPENRFDRLLAPVVFEGVVEVPYCAVEEFDNLIVQVTAPCGCVAYYNSQELFLKEAVLDPCGQGECDFQWARAEQAVFDLMA